MIYGDFLYLRCGEKELPFAVPINGAITDTRGDPIQVGPVALLDPDYEPGFRVGFARCLSESSSLGAEYTFFESETQNWVITDNNVLRPLLRHPAREASPTNYLEGAARFDVDFDLVDAIYRVALLKGPRGELTFLGGGCFAHERQVFKSRFQIPDVETVETDIVFDGGGIRLGLEGERISLRTGLMVYGRTSARFVAGEFDCTFAQGTGTDPNIIDTRWDGGRVVSILDLELGIGWASPKRCFRLNAGWMFNGWFNTVNTHEWIQAVQANDFAGLSDSITFNGLVTRAELRW
jgi:hypothetical protein